MTLSPQQLTLIQQQLGRPPRGIVSIAAESASGIPLVLQMRSLVDNQPFPTLYWLSSKTLSKAIGSIETLGWVKSIEQRLQDDDALREQFLQNQRGYVASRWQKMDSNDKALIEQLGFSPLFEQYGIGGITQWDKVRCLHMQYAHHLAESNVIGALMDEEFQLNELEIEL
ncbi:DUF501 domain-containing protein [Dasania marina]|uniref:DUF501 domain-containing protein n=1 Tax=Dasania marina TaxID=471499 RepID=UPI0030D75C9E|tara:strand:+ start:32458 stop:32967 length:510 start_codon:yes stop_codon:yes gene_type:complete